MESVEERFKFCLFKWRLTTLPCRKEMKALASPGRTQDINQTNRPFACIPGPPKALRVLLAYAMWLLCSLAPRS